MESEEFFRTFLEGTTEIIQSDRACTDILRWANKVSISQNPNPSIETVAALLLCALKSEISRMVSSLRHYQSQLYDGSGQISDEEWKAIDEKNELWDLEEALSALLLEIVKRVNGSEEKYSKSIEQNKDANYDGARFRLETVRKMRRYLEATILFLKSLDESNTPEEVKTKYTSQLLEMGQSIEEDSSVSSKDDDHSIDLFVLGMMKEIGIITYDNHIPKITERGIDLFKEFYQKQVMNAFKEMASATDEQIQTLFSDEVMQVDKDEAKELLIHQALLESDGETLTDKGMEFFLNWTRGAFVKRSSKDKD